MDKPGKKIVLARKAKGWSQERMADEAGINLRTIQRIEKGISNPYGETLMRISKALNVPIEELVNYGAQQNVGYIKIMHFSDLIFIVLPFGNIFLPLIIWLIRKNDVINISYFAMKLLNFQISWTIVLWFPFIWKMFCQIFNIKISIVPFFLSPWQFLIYSLAFLYLLNIVYLIIVGSIISEKQKNYFPVAIRFIK